MSIHPHIVEVKEVFLTPCYFAMVMEHVEGETLEVRALLARQTTLLPSEPPYAPSMHSMALIDICPGAPCTGSSLAASHRLLACHRCLSPLRATCMIAGTPGEH
jgi:hypothetical protein